MSAVELDGRVALVTGAASGMGRGTARRLAAEGMQVCVVDVDAAGAQAVADEIGGLAFAADVSDSTQVDAAFAACIGAFGGIDLAHLNAGVTGFPDIGTVTDEQYARIRGVNQDHLVYGARAFVRAIRGRTDGREGGALVATSSIAGLDPFHPDPFYTLTKFAVVGLMRAIALQLAEDGIVTHVICPDIVDTGMTQGYGAVVESLGITMVTPEQIGDAVVQAVRSDPALTGSCWVVHADRVYAYQATVVPGPHNRLNRFLADR